ncbi:MAG: hypothetical protein J0I20_26680 [Chloroflexi bacterium]|nr:hypothetical protein [Chloroflexota bacterium]OJV99258.1 MAG: hypothetical protein BGO39_17535 [Chloroflexi bacterium 54-19]
MSNSEMQLVIEIILGVVIVGYMAYNQLAKVQYVNPAKLWRVPLLLAIWNVYNLKDSINDPATVAVVLAALGMGTVIGVVRGLINRVSFDHKSDQLVVFGSLAGMLVWLGGLAISLGLRVFLNGTPLGLVVSPALLLGIFSGWRLVWQLKYNQLMTVRQSF